MRRTRIVVVAMSAVVVLLPPLLSEAVNGSPGGSQVSTRRSVESGPARVPSGKADFAELGRLSGRELKLWASRFLQDPTSDGFLHSEIECQTAAGATPDLKLDCDSQLPNNEPDIEVDPEDPDHIVASSNDYDSCCDGFYTSFDGGETWAQGNLSAEDTRRIGSDPVTVFEPKSGNVIHASLNFLITRDGFSKDGDVVVSISRDGGLTWRRPVVVADGQGKDTSRRQLFNDKEWIVADTDPGSPFYGRTYMTWSAFLLRNGEYAESAIMEAHSDDGGRTWSAPQEISGSAPFCDIQYEGPTGDCDQDQYSVPTAAPDGSVYVAFENEQNSAIQEPLDAFPNPRETHDSQYLVVKSVDGGVTWSDPVIAATLEDGRSDYPVNVDKRRTLTGYQVRVNSAGNIVAGPTGTLYLVWSDNRNGTPDRKEAVTNTDIFLTTSNDGGDTWSAPITVASNPGDQWFPWVDAHPTTDEIAIVYHTRNQGTTHLYNTVVSRGTPAALTRTRVSTQPSDPTRAVFFKAEVKGCFSCATFMGDYNRLAYGPDGTVHATWTDMSREYRRAKNPPKYFQFIFYRRLP